MYRIGQGMDVHRLQEGLPLVLGGVDIPSEKGAVGHSDADVVLHAIIDAIFGAAGMRDIGYHFPDTDHQYEGISSLKLLAYTLEIIGKKGWKIGNIDATIALQNPKIGKYIPEMQNNISRIVNTNAVNIKATTTEHLGFVGRGEGIQAFAVVMIYQ